jgi:TolA-binding protein
MKLKMMKKRNYIIFLIVSLISLLNIRNAFALDEILLKNGSKISGEIIAADTKQLMLELSGKKVIYTVNYEDILRIESPKPQAMILADNHFFFEDYETAYKEYLEVMAQFGPLSWGAKANLKAAECQMKLGKKDRALKMYKNFIEKYPQAANIDYFKKDLGDIFFKDRNWDEAAKLYYQVASSISNDDLKPEAYYKLAESYFNKGEYEEALIGYLYVIVLYFQDAKLTEISKYKSALCYEKLANNKKALETYKEFVAEWSESKNKQKAEEKIRELSKKGE